MASNNGDNFRALIQAELDTSKVKQQIKEFDRTQITLNADVSQAEKELNKIQNKNIKLDINTKSAIKDVDNLGSSLKKALNIGSTYAIAAQGIKLVKSAISSAVNTIREMDAAITNLKVVTGLSNADLKTYLNDYGRLAKELHTTTTEIINMGTAWQRQGKTAAETRELIKSSATLSKTALIDETDAVNYLTSALNGYRLATSQANSVVDKFAVLDSNAAITAAGLAEGLSKVANTANDSGVSLDKMLGYLSTVGEVTQSSLSSIGQAFKTIFTRMSSIKLSKLELIDSDGTTESLSNVETTLKNAGIDIRKTVTEFDSFENVLDNLALKWHTLNDLQKSAISSAIAGNRQTEYFRALMNNYDKVKKYTDLSANSAGTAEQKFSKYAESIEAKSKRLQASFESLVFNDTAQSFVGGMQDIAAEVVTFVDKANLLKGTLSGLVAIGVIKGFTTLASVIGNTAIRFNEFNAALKLSQNADLSVQQIEQLSVMTSHLSKSQTKAVLSSKTLTNEQRISILTANGLSDAEAKAALNTLQLSSAESTATQASFSFKGALKGLWATLMANPLVAIGAAIAGTVSIISTVKQKADDLAQANAEQAQKAAESAKELKDSLDGLSDYQTKIDSLVKAINDDNTSQADAVEKRKELLTVQEELIKKYGHEEEVIKSITDALNGEANALNRVDKANSKDWLDKNRKDVEQAQNFLNEINTFTITWNSKRDTKFNEGGWKSLTKEDFDKHSKDTAGYDSWEDYLLEPNTQIHKWVEQNSQFASFESNGYVGFKGTRGEILDYYQRFRSFIDNFVEENYNKLSIAQRNLYEELLTNISNSMNYIEDGANGDNRYNNSKEILQNAAQFAVAYDDKLSKLYQAYQDRQAEYTEAESSGDQLLINQAYENVKNAYDSLLNGADRDIGNVQQATIQEWITDLQAEFEAAAGDTPLVIDIKAELNNSDSVVKQIADSVQKQNLTKDGLNNLILTGKQNPDSLSENDNSLIQSINDYISGYTKATITTDEFINALQKLGIVQSEVNQSTETSFGLSDEQRESLKAVYTDYDKLNKAYQDLRQDKLTSSDVAELTKAFPDLLKYVDWTSDKFGNLATGIETVISQRPKDLIEQLKAINTDSMSDEGKAAIQSLITALQALKPELKDTKTFIDNIKSSIKGISGSISALIGFINEIKDNGSLSLSSIDTIMSDDTYQSLRPYINDMESMKAAVNDLISKQKEAYEDLYNAQMYEQDAEAYHKAVEKKQQSDENLFKDSVQRIQDEIKYFNDVYNVDITNWDNLTDTKKATLQNTNAELLSKQNKLINQFSDGYGVDLTNFKNTTQAKADILKKFNESKVYAQINDLIDSDPKSTYRFDRNTGKLIGRYASPETQQKINAILESSGLTYADYANYRDKGVFTQEGNKALGQALDSLVDNVVNAFSIDTTDWEKLTGKTKNKSNSSSKNYLDWMERRLKKFAQTTKEVFAKVADYISFSGKNSQLSKAITAVRNQISAYESAYQSYMNQANKLGLDSEWVTFIQNGGSGITDMSKYSEEFREKVSRYQELYDKAIDCKNAIADLKKTETEYATQMLDNIDKYYSNRLTQTSTNADYYNSLDTDNQFIIKNYGVIASSYSTQIAYTESKAKQLNTTLNELIKSGTIKAQSNEWFEYVDRIQRCNIEVRNLKKSLHELASEELQNIQSYWNNRINGIDNTISYINTTSGDSTRKGNKDYNSLSSSYTSQIGYINKEVSELQNRLDKAVKAGDIEKYSKTWYEWTSTIEQAKQKIKELQTNIHQLAADQFNDIQTNYDNQLKNIENKQKAYESKNKEIETRGYTVTAQRYALLQGVEQNKINVLKQQAAELENSLKAAVQANNIQSGSLEWHKMKEAIQETNDKIDESTIKLLEYRKTMREIEWQVFDLLQDKISQLNAESDFVIDLFSDSQLFDDDGNITAKGKTTAGLHTQNYEIYKEQAKQYAAEIRKINVQIANDSTNKDLIKRKEELLSLQQKSITAAKKEKKAIVDLTKNGYDKQLKALKDLISNYTTNLEANKTLYEYQKSVNNKTSNISKLQKQLSAYAGDVSEETMAKIQQLQVELKDAQQDLQETEYDKFISDTKSLLDDLYNDYEETINKRLDDVNGLINNTIVSVNQGTAEINNTIKSAAAEFGFTLSDAVKSVWDSEGVISDRIVNMLGSLNDNVASITGTGTGTYKKYATGGLIDYTGIAQVDGTPSKPELVLNANDTQNFINLRDRLRQLSSQPLTLQNGVNNMSVANLAPMPMMLLSESDLKGRLKEHSNITSNVTNNFNNEFTFAIDHVDDYNDLCNKLKNDKKFEALIQDMTIGRINGGNPLKKHRNNW